MGIKGKVIKRVFRYEIPDTEDRFWEFEFYVTFKQVSEDWVLMQYEEKSIPAGKHMIRDCGVTWSSLFLGNKELYAIAAGYVWYWNLLEERGETPATVRAPCNTRTKLIHNRT